MKKSSHSLPDVSPAHDETEMKLNFWLPVMLSFFAVVVCALYTRQVWEDYYITFRSSRNLIEGHGLVYETGEHIHTFTSPLGVLVPAAGYWLTQSDVGALWMLRLFNAAALAGAMFLVGKYSRDQRMHTSSTWFILVLGILDAKTVGFSSNGMETGMLVFFTALTWRELTRTDIASPFWLALGCAGLMWTRPDACVLITAMMLACWIFISAKTPLSWWRKVAPAAVIGGLIYAPWFFWAWHYYGSPVPQTVIAKTAMTPEGFSVSRIILAPLRCLTENTALDGLSAPSYFFAGGWPRDLLDLCRLFARGAAFLWLIPSIARPARAASLTVLIGGVYLHQINPYPWYFGPWTLLAACAWAGALEAASHHSLPWIRSAARIGRCVFMAMALAIFISSIFTAREQQHLVEDKGRKQIGLWLRTNAHPHDTVFLESLGYMGYFSGLKMLDFPGLSSPEVSSLVKSCHRSYAEIIDALHPDWVVIRPSEYYNQHLNTNHGLQGYKLAWTSDRQPSIDAIPLLPGRGTLEGDAVYLIFQHTPSAAHDIKSAQTNEHIRTPALDGALNSSSPSPTTPWP